MVQEIGNTVITRGLSLGLKKWGTNEQMNKSTSFTQPQKPFVLYSPSLFMTTPARGVASLALSLRLQHLSDHGTAHLGVRVELCAFLPREITPKHCSHLKVLPRLLLAALQQMNGPSLCMGL